MSYFSPVELWLIIGCLSLAIEFTKLPGIGFLFLGFGALLNAILVYNYPLFLEYQYTSFGLLSFLWFIILWWPLKKYVYKKDTQGSNFDIVGSEVEVYASPMRPGNMGQVKWSGTIMNAQLEDNEPDGAAKVGERLRVTGVHGNVLICRKIASILHDELDK